MQATVAQFTPYKTIRKKIKQVDMRTAFVRLVTK